MQKAEIHVSLEQTKWWNSKDFAIGFLMGAVVILGFLSFAIQAQRIDRLQEIVNSYEKK